MTIKATNVKCKDLRPGDLFSAMEQEYWDKAASGNHLLVPGVVGERVFIRTEAPCPESQAEDPICLIEIERKP